MRATWGSELGRMRPWKILIFYTEQSEGGGYGHTWTSGDRLRREVGCSSPHQALAPLPALLNYGKSFKLLH